MGAGLGPRKAVKSFLFEQRSHADIASWVEAARIDSIIGSCRRSLPSVRSGIVCYVAFVDVVIGKVASYFPPQITWLQAWAAAFRCRRTFCNYIGYIKTACLLVKKDVQVFQHPALGRAKLSIEKAGNFVPRKRMWVQREQVAAMLDWAKQHKQWMIFAHLFLLAYSFLARLPSEALPVVSGRGRALNAHAVLWKSETELVLDLKVRKNTNHSCRIVRACLCKESAATCPLHVLGPLVDACPEGEPIFRGISRAAVLSALRRLLGEIGVADAGLYGTHDLRRGHALDLQLSKAPLWKILDAGGWRSPAFLKYLDMHQLDRDLVVQAHIAESSSD